MALNVPGQRTVRVIRRIRLRAEDGSWARSSRGDAVYVTTTVDVPGCSIQPSSSAEDTAEGRIRVSTLTTIYAPTSWPSGPIDAVEFDDAQWEVVGRPLRWDHPRLGHVVVTVQEASG